MASLLRQWVIGPGNGFAGWSARPKKFTISSQGNGSGVAMLSFESTNNVLITVDGSARFYDDAGGTVNPTTQRTILPGAMRTLYLKVPSGISTLTINNPDRLIKWGDTDFVNHYANYVDGFYSSGPNSPVLGGYISGLPNITELCLFNYGETNCALNYNWRDIPRGLQGFDLTSLGLGGGLVSQIPRGIMYIYTFCDHTTTGNVKDLPSTLVNYTHLAYYQNERGKLYGNISDIPVSIRYFFSSGKDEIGGNINAFQSNFRSISLESETNSHYGDIHDLPANIDLFSSSGIGEIHYTAGRTWNDGLYEIWLVPLNYGLSVSEQANLIIDISKAAWSRGRDTSWFDFAGTCASMADTTQGGIWGDFSGAPSPSPLAVALKTLNSKVYWIGLKGIELPGVTGDGVGFPAGFGNWWRS